MVAPDVRLYRLVEQVFDHRLAHMRRYFTPSGAATADERAAYAQNPFCASAGLVGGALAGSVLNVVPHTEAQEATQKVNAGRLVGQGESREPRGGDGNGDSGGDDGHDGDGGGGGGGEERKREDWRHAQLVRTAGSACATELESACPGETNSSSRSSDWRLPAAVRRNHSFRVGSVYLASRLPRPATPRVSFGLADSRSPRPPPCPHTAPAPPPAMFLALRSNSTGLPRVLPPSRRPPSCAVSGLYAEAHGRVVSPARGKRRHHTRRERQSQHEQ